MTPLPRVSILTGSRLRVTVADSIAVGSNGMVGATGVNGVGSTAPGPAWRDVAHRIIEEPNSKSDEMIVREYRLDACFMADRSISESLIGDYPSNKHYFAWDDNPTAPNRKARLRPSCEDFQQAFL
jgi:hypothetical protein